MSAQISQFAKTATNRLFEYLRRNINRLSAKGYEIETSLTLDYRKEKWGLERIVLDGVANHLPADAGGSEISVRFRQNGEWRDLKTVDNSLGVEEIVIEDNGRGYNAKKLARLRSTKTADARSVGQFGEGLKLVAAAALRNNLALEYRSRNWTGVPFAKKEEDEGEVYNVLCFKVTENGESIKGSQTVFYNPSAELVQEFLRLPENVLAFNENCKELHNEKDRAKLPYDSLYDFQPPFGFYPKGGIRSKIYQEDTFFTDIGTDIGDNSLPLQTSPPQKVKVSNEKYHSRIVSLGTDTKKGIFNKGIRFKGFNREASTCLFSYDLGLEDIPPDREFANYVQVKAEIGNLLQRCTNTEVIDALLVYAHERKEGHYFEFEALAPEPLPSEQLHSGSLSKQINYDLFKKNIDQESLKSFKENIDLFKELKEKNEQNLWVKRFRKLFGEKAVLASINTPDNEESAILGYIPIPVHDTMKKYLHSLGIQGVSEIVEPKNKSIEYRWVEKEQLSPEERQTLGELPALTEIILGEAKAIDIRIYEGMFNADGTEIQSSLGVYIKEADGKKYIGLKRAHLNEGLEKVGETYVHELAHYETGAEDYSRQHAQQGFDWTTKLALQMMKQKKNE